ncbi:hypothetical protein AWC19_03130 [Mycobacterium palustre]|uniref:DUF732 domain-containing protein n=1 Tax=Mycobacterium palustre TaxID=153971 RepID=A0A1X1ZTM8_9MYCO|nr:hypothetical protein AWC19_03130 [Mycobacterium palustre]
MIVPPPVATEPGLAWSQDDELDDAVFREPWRAALVAAAAILVITGSIAFVISTWQRHRPAEHVVQGGIMEPATMPAAELPPITAPAPIAAPAPPPPGPSMAPPTVTVAAPVPTITVTQTPSPTPIAVAPPAPRGDQVFLSEARAGGLVILDESVATADARQGCAYMAAGHTPAQAEQLALEHNPSLTLQQAQAYVRATIDAYCPQY